MIYNSPFKTMKEIGKKIENELRNEKPILCAYIIAPNGPQLADPAILSTDHKCQWCNGTAHHAIHPDPAKSAAKAWLCANINCDVYKKKSRLPSGVVAPQARRALEWSVFCEFNDIGDLLHDVTFEKIDQPKPKVDYLFKFAQKPQGIIFMQGDKGLGKTYACLATCELYTRTKTNCLFLTQESLFQKWLEGKFDVISRIKEIELLIIDDFGTGELSPGFMKYFMGLINIRIQWSDRGTIITTNLDDKTFSEYCGKALTDRINTGQKFVFTGKSRRAPIIL